MSEPKNKPYRNPKYLKWIKTQPCCRCGNMGSDPHHIIGLAGYIGGMGTKASDALCMPLCRTCHDMMHLHSEEHHNQFEYIANTLDRALREGVLK